MFVPPTRPYTNLIISPWMWSEIEGPAEAFAAESKAMAAAAENGAMDYRRAASIVAQTMKGHAAEAMSEAHQQLALKHQNLTFIHEAAAKAGQRCAALASDLNRSLDALDQAAHSRIAGIPKAQHPPLIAEARAEAEAMYGEFTVRVGEIAGNAHSEMAPHAAALGVPLSPAGGGSIVHPVGNGIQRRNGPSSDNKTPVNGDKPDGFGNAPQHRGDTGSSDSGESSADGANSGVLGGPQRHREVSDKPAAAAPGQAAPLTGTGMSGGGVPGGLGGGMPGGGSGLSGSPLSGLGSGAGGLSGAASPSGLSGLGSNSSATGITGMPSGLSGGAVDPSAFSRGVAAGSGAVSSAGPLGPPPGLPGSAASGANASTSAGAAGVSSGSVAPAASGVSGGVPAAAGGAVGSPASGSPGMLLPSPGMGAPAAAGAGAAAGASVTVPQGGPPGSAGSGSGGGGAGVGSAVPLAPAPHVVARNIRAAQAGDGPESPDMTAALKLAARLVADCTAADYPTIDWCAGVFRSADGAADMVVVSNAGFGYVPAGVYVPRTARVIGSDPLVDEAFRNRWFGWADPARILVEYGRLRPEGWQLVAAATTTDDVDALRDNGIEYRIAQRPDNASLLSPPVLDADHQHRLELEHRDLHERLMPLLGPAAERWMRERVAVPLGQAAMHGLVAAGVDCPDELRVVWRALMDEQRAPTQAEWGAFSDRCRGVYLEPDFSRPVGDPLPDAGIRPQAIYEKPWRLARTMELVLSWYLDPPVLPLADMAYAAAAAGVDVRVVLSEPLRLVESHLS